MSGRGGARPGAGRKARADKHSGAIAEAEQRIADRLPELIDNLLILARGVPVYRAKRGQEPITDPGELAGSDDADFYLEPPDYKANEYLLNRILGRPTERVEAEHSGDLTIRVVYADADAEDPEAAPGPGEDTEGGAAV